jgi:selenide,water dikinase
VGLETLDDAAVYRMSEDQAIVQSVDFFTPVVDNPWDWGRIAAANAMSDIYAMGARPMIALNLVGWPRSLDFELLGRVLEGSGSACDEAGVAVVGGHSVDDPEPKFGLAVTGTVHPDAVVRQRGAVAGCDLVLTKPLGMGIISSGIKEGRTTPETVKQAVESMSSLNRAASEAMLDVDARAATDVTGYGLIGHLLEMLGPETGATVSFSSVPVLEEAIELAARGVLPGGSKRNYDSMRERVDSGALDEARRAVLFDAQTSGGLLIAVDADRTDALLADLDRREVHDAARIGSITEGSGTIRVEK